MTGFKDLLAIKNNQLDSIDWIHNKGSVKTCKADETGRKMRCKVGLGYGLKVELSLNEVELIWEAFQKFFKESYFERIERNRNRDLIMKIVSISLQLTNGIRTLSTGFMKVLMKNG